MNWTLSKIATSLMGLLGQPEKKVSDSTLDNRCEDIREAMLAVLDQCGSDVTTKGYLPAGLGPRSRARARASRK